MTAVLDTMRNVRFRVPLGSRCTLRIGGPARILAEPTSEVDLVELMGYLNSLSMPFKVIGKGANLLIDDAGYDGAVVVLGPGFGGLDLIDGDVLEVGAGLSLSALAHRASRLGIGGFEFASGIPGTIGGGVVNNSGAHGQEVGDRFLLARGIDVKGRPVLLNLRDLDPRYRSTRLRQRQDVVLTAVRLQGVKRDPREILDRIREHRTHRNLTQPTREFTSGCVFKNPVGACAGALIESAGLKGEAVGGVHVSRIHANFIINQGGGTARGVKELIHRIQDRVHQCHGIALQPEIEFV